MSAPFPAPMARFNHSPGHRPGKPETQTTSALKGRSKPCPNRSNGIAWLLTSGTCGIKPPLQGLSMLGNLVPRALPWAAMVHPFGVDESRILAALRNALLPKLLSGELRVPAGKPPEAHARATLSQRQRRGSITAQGIALGNRKRKPPQP